MHPENTRFCIHQIKIKKILALVNCINQQKKYVHWTDLISQTKAKSIQFNTKFQMSTKTADFKFTQYRFNTNICAQTANFIGDNDISNFLNITEYRCAYMRITEVSQRLACCATTLSAE